jgi:hypothetical protein
MPRATTARCERNAPFLRQFRTKVVHLPRQARDKHQETLEKKEMSPAGGVSGCNSVRNKNAPLSIHYSNGAPMRKKRSNGPDCTATNSGPQHRSRTEAAEREILCVLAFNQRYDRMRCGPRNPRLLAIQQDPAASPGWLLTGSEASQSFVDLGRGQPHVRTLPCNSGTFSQMWEPIAVAAAADEEAGVFMFRQNTTAAVCVALCCVAAGTTFQFCLSPTGVYVCMFNCVSLRAGFGFVQVRIPRRHEPLPRTRPLSNARHGERHGSRAPFSF